MGEFEGIISDPTDCWSVTFTDNEKKQYYVYGTSKNEKYDLIVEKLKAYSGIEVITSEGTPISRFYKNRG